MKNNTKRETNMGKGGEGEGEKEGKETVVMVGGGDGDACVRVVEEVMGGGESWVVGGVSEACKAR